MSDPLASRAALITGVTVLPVGGHAFALGRLRFTDTLSRPFQLDVELISTGGDVPVEDLLGQDLTIALARPAGGTRHLHGIVRHAVRRVVAGDAAVYACTAVPHIAVSELGSDFRIHLDKSVTTILETTLGELRLPHDAAGVTGDYPDLRQCVQYGESHAAFVHRLLERFGIYYYHHHAAGVHTLKLVDSSAAHGPLVGAESLPFKAAAEAAVAEEHVYFWETRGAMQAGAFATKDYDYLDPATEVMATQTASPPHAYPHGAQEWFEYPAGCLRIAEAKAAAGRRIDERTCRGLEVRGEARATGLAVGHTFKLTGSPVASDNASYLVTGVDLTIEPTGGNDPAGKPRGQFTTTCRFTAIPATAQFRPERTTPAPRVHGVQPAVVVGPAGQNPKMPYTDNLGRIKVQFHWDRHGKKNENSSCWLRTPHQSAGNGYGHVWLPRIGCEVLVAFVDGDPDRPTIVGHVYNGQTTLPLDLPAEADHAIIKDDGGNYIRIEPTDGEQRQILYSPVKNTRMRIGKG